MNAIGRRAGSIVAALLIGFAVFNLERARSGLEISQLAVGATPVTHYRIPDTTGPLVVVTHGFAGSRQLMQSFSLDLARAGYQVLAFDFEGHGRNPMPMSGDISRVDGTTALLAAETQRVLAYGRGLSQVAGGVALLGHSMATDIIIRAAQAEAQAQRRVDAVVAISMFSEAVSPSSPQRLLIISGQWESRLRELALKALQQVDPQVIEGDTAVDGMVLRRAVVAPGVEHVGVLYSAAAINETQRWLDQAFHRTSKIAGRHRGLWILALLLGIVMLFGDVIRLLPARPREIPEISTARFFAATVIPAIGVPLIATSIYVEFLPLLVADYLLVHLALFGLAQWLALGAPRNLLRSLAPLGILALVVWGIGLFGFALDRHGASFWPTPGRLLIIAVLSLGTIPFMLADSLVTQAGRARWWRRIVARLACMGSLAAAAALDPERLTFVVIVLPVLLLFFLVYGLMGRWVAQRMGPAPAGIGLGLCLAWALGVSFPLFAG